jgi:hypothetical protein
MILLGLAGIGLMARSNLGSVITRPGAILVVMPLSVQHRHALLLADRTHDVGVVTAVVTEALTANPETNLLEIEQAFRDGTAAAYLVATSDGFEVVLGMMAMLAAVSKAGVTPAENRAALAAAKTSTS